MISKSPVKAVIWSGFVAGFLDITGAIAVYVWILQRTTTLKLLQGIASGVFKEKAHLGGFKMAFYGLLLHFFIAYCFAIAYFLLFPFLPFLRKQKILSGLLYGVFVWLVMNFVVLPLVFPGRPAPGVDSFLIGVSILMLMIGLPVSLITHQFYVSKRG